MAKQKELKGNTFRDFKFNQALCTELDQLLGVTKVYQKQFKLEEEKNKLEKQVQSLQGTIEVMKQDKRETDAKHAQDLFDQRTEFEATRAHDKADTDAKITELRDLIKSMQQASTSDTQTQESSNASSRLFKS